MTKRFFRVVLTVMAVMLLAGCSMQTVDRMYCLPKRSEAYTDLQVAIDSAMIGMEYWAPISGENQQTVQTADLDGDGTMECLLYAKGSGEKPLQILIFKPTEEGYELSEIISSYGTYFDQVEYVQVDDKTGLELVVGRQLSDQVARSVSIYSFASGQSEQLVNVNCSRYLTCDLDADYNRELIVLRAGESEEDNGVAEYYSFAGGVMERSTEVAMSEPAEKMKRIVVSKLADGTPAVYVASSVDENAIITDIFAIVRDRFVNVTFSNESGTSVRTLRNYFVYADDIDEDGTVELPSLITMHRRSEDSQGVDQQYLVRWYAMMPNGDEVNKMYTYHNFGGGWYVILDEEWISRIEIVQQDGEYSFYLLDENGRNSQKVMTIYAFTGQDREELAVTENRFVLTRGESVVYAAQLEVAAVSYGIDNARLIESFHLIHQDWRTGET